MTRPRSRWWQALGGLFVLVWLSALFVMFVRCGGRESAARAGGPEASAGSGGSAGRDGGPAVSDATAAEGDGGGFSLGDAHPYDAYDGPEYDGDQSCRADGGGMYALHTCCDGVPCEGKCLLLSSKWQCNCFGIAGGCGQYGLYCCWDLGGCGVDCKGGPAP